MGFKQAGGVGALVDTILGPQNIYRKQISKPKRALHLPVTTATPEYSPWPNVLSLELHTTLKIVNRMYFNFQEDIISIWNRNAADQVTTTRIR